jgi:hypothetical protein
MVRPFQCELPVVVKQHIDDGGIRGIAEGCSAVVVYTSGIEGRIKYVFVGRRVLTEFVYGKDLGFKVPDDFPECCRLLVGIVVAIGAIGCKIAVIEHIEMYYTNRILRYNRKKIENQKKYNRNA